MGAAPGADVGTTELGTQATVPTSRPRGMREYFRLPLIVVPRSSVL